MPHPRAFRRTLFCTILGSVLAALFLLPSGLCAQIIRVPSEQASLQDAIAAVPDNGIIELAAGTYVAPGGGFTIYNISISKSFTIRAATGATVILSGGGNHDIIRYGNPPQSISRPVIFQGLTFIDGLSTSNFIGGAMTLTSANAIFSRCTFHNNAANPSTSGGGVFWLQSASVSFEQCEFYDNTSRNYGAAMSALDSRVFLRGCTFRNNRTNVPNHSRNAVGGAITNTDSSFRIDNCRFENNQAGFVGGAIFCGGGWRDPVSKPSAELLVSNSLFTGNSASPDPSSGSNGFSVAGAVHLEDQTTGRFVNCRFLNNSARQAGAISIYRAIAEIEGCIFEGNVALGSGAAEGVGGSIFAQSADVPDSSTNGGATNRRSISLDVRDSVFRGPASGARSALYGGAIFVAGDTNSAFGRNGMVQNGTEDSNRATFNLTRVAFMDLNTTGSAGAVSCSFAAFKMEKSFIENCQTQGDSGAIRMTEATKATITDSTIARCRAATLGGGLLIFGGTLDMSNTNLVENVMTGGGGSAMVSGAANTADGIPGRPIDGIVQGCVFSNNTGDAMIYDGDSVNPPYNLLRYNNNQFYSDNATVLYRSDIVGALSLADFNAVRITRLVGPPTQKVEVANSMASAKPAVGAILMVPRTVLTNGAPGESLPLPSLLAYTFSGANGFLDNGLQTKNAGAVPTTIDGVHTLTVGSSSYANTPPPAAALNISTRLPVGTGDNALIGGFIVQGNSPKRVIVRGVGPSLSTFLTGALENPTLELHDSRGAIVATSDNWKSSQAGGIVTPDQYIDIHGSGVAPSNDLEPAIVATLEPNQGYTAVVRGANDATGIAVVEVYDLDATQSSTLANISTRGFVRGGDDVMIAGLIVLGGSGPTNIVVRGLGPSTGVAGALANPVLELHNANGTSVDTNDNWSASPQASQILALGLNPGNAAESVLFETGLPRGAYTAILQGANNGVGIGLIEAYIFP
jgi:hypothetical protein